MRESNFEVFDPRTLIIDSPEHDHDCDQADFGFAFNNSNFSDRVLRIYIFSESTQPPSAIRVKTLHVSSSILSARSPFFYKLFSNGMRESEQYHATLRISVSEEVGLMELLKFMYSNKLTVTAAIDVFDVLMAADKFDVASCMRHCRHLLRNIMIMTPEFVLVYLDLPSTILMAEALQPLTVFAKQFYAVHYKDITKFEDEILSLPLASVEAIIASDYMQVVPSEDVVYSFVLKWVQAQYPKLEDHCEILNTRLAKLIRYPYMTYRELENVFHSNELDRFLVLRVLLEALFFQRHYLPPSGTNDANRHRFVKRQAHKDRQPAETPVQDCSHWTWKGRLVFLCFTVGFLYFTGVCSRLKLSEECVHSIRLMTDIDYRRKCDYGF